MITMLPRRCQLTKTQLIDEYFIENRTKLLDVAAFLDRIDRAEGDAAESGFKMEAFARAVCVLTDPGPARVEAISMAFSDPTTELLTGIDRKGAQGAYDPARDAR